MPPPLIYNLFPRLAGALDSWPAHAERARAMGFNWIFLNPVSQPGFSGSLYAVRDHDRVARDFLPAGASSDGLVELERTLDAFRGMGLRTMIDLVINHTAIDSPLVEQHPDWFKRDERGAVLHPSAIDPADARLVTVWGDLAEIDNAGSPDREGLWAFWRDQMRRSLELGFTGFRCDAAYKVPAALWQELIGEARRIEPGSCFVAETLGCRIEEVGALKAAGFDYLLNSSKYWNFDAPWALEQHAQFGTIAPSISFPESHDTPRLMAETGGNLAVQRQRYLLAAVFSEGLLMPIGYEFGFTKPLHVVDSRPQDWEHTDLDLRAFIAAVNGLKLELGGLQAEGRLAAVTGTDQPTIVLEKTTADRKTLVLVNKDWHRPQPMAVGELERPAVASLIRIRPDGTVRRESVTAELILDPAEIALIA